MRKLILHILSGLLFLVSSVAAANPVVDYHGRVLSITFAGNESTKEPVLLQEMLIKTGDLYDPAKVEASRQGIMDLGLFKSVEVERFQQEAGVTLLFRVDEKFYFLPLPRVSRSADGDINYGGQFRFDNFLGLNHQLKITAQRKRESDGRIKDEYRVNYNVPRFIGTAYGMQMSMFSSKAEVETQQNLMEVGEAAVDSSGFRLGTTRWLNEGVSQGWQLGVGMGFESRDYALVSGELGDQTSGQNISLTVGARYRDWHTETYRRRGMNYGASLGMGLRGVGGDFSYRRLDFFYQHYLPLNEPAIENLNIQFLFGFADGGPFGDHTYNLGGGDTMRGKEKSTLKGDTMLLFNLEYLTAFERYPSLRWMMFTDIGNAWRRHHLDLTELEMTVGVGLRWKIQSLVKTTLRWDVGYDPDRSTVESYLGTKFAF